MQQLAMRWTKKHLPVIALSQSLPPGVVIRTYKEGDKEALKDALIPLTEVRYSDEKLDEVILQRVGVRPEGIFLAEMNGEIVGTTTGYFNEDQTRGTLHMVSALSKAGGKGLGKILCQHAMDYLVNNGCNEIVLTTDDFRLAAIKTYLNLEFEPVISDKDMQARWDKVRENLRNRVE